MYSITLQTNDNVVTSGERLGQIQFAASSESDGSAAIDIAGSVFCQAEGSFQSASNPTSIVLATAAADASAAVGRIKVTDNGHLVPVAADSYDLGDTTLRFRDVHASGGVFLSDTTPSVTTNKLYNEGGTLKFNGSAVGGGGGTPGGADTNVQYNNAGSFGGEADFTYNATTNTLTVPTGKFDIVNFTNADSNVYVGNGVSQTSNDFNILVGQSAGDTDLFIGNIGVGYRSLNTVGAFTTYNVCLGYQTMYSSRGGRNIAIGYEAMYDVGTNNLIQTNIGIGQRALAAIDGDDNIEITTIYGPSENTGMGTTVSDRLNIGHTIFGDLANRKIRIGMSGVVTSFDTAPDATLEVLPESASDLVLLAKGTNSQSANLQEWRNAADTTLLAVGFDGGLEIPSNTPSTTTNKLFYDGSTLRYGSNDIIDSSMISDGLEWKPISNAICVSNLTTSEFAASTLVIESEGIASNDNDTTIPTSAAVKDYVDNNTGSLSNVVEDTTPQLGGHLDSQSYHISGVGLLELEGGFKTTLESNTDGATVTFDLDAANTHTVTLGGNRTLALSNVDVGQKFIIRLVQDGTGSRTVTWFSTIKWPGNLVPTLTETGGKTDVFGFICTATNQYDGYVIGYNL